MTKTPYLPEGCELVEHEIAIAVECPFTHSADVIQEYVDLGWRCTGSGPKRIDVGRGSLTIAHLRFAKPVDEPELPEGADLESLIAHGHALAAKHSVNTGEDGLLDDAVHDAASHVGAAVNNEGVESQICFLAEQLGVEEAGYVIDAAAKGEAPT